MVEVGLVTTEAKEVLPNLLVHDLHSELASNGGEEFIANNMTLGRDVAGGQIECAANGLGVKRRGAKVNAKCRALGPLGQFPTILKLVVENPGGTSPDASLGHNTVARWLESGEEFHGRQLATSLGEVVPEIDGVFEGEGPKLDVEGLVPMQQLVKHHGERPHGHGLDSSFSCPVLVVCSHSAVADLLVLKLEVGLELSRSERMVISSTPADGDTALACKFFERMLGLRGLPRLERDLISQEDQTTGVVDKDAATVMAQRAATSFFFGVWEPTWSAALALIAGHAVTWIEVFSFDRHALIHIGADSLIVRGASMLFGHHTGRTDRVPICLLGGGELGWHERRFDHFADGSLD